MFELTDSLVESRFFTVILGKTKLWILNKLHCCRDFVKLTVISDMCLFIEHLRNCYVQYSGIIKCICFTLLAIQFLRLYMDYDYSMVDDL
jgi:hypothetical protein